MHRSWLVLRQGEWTVERSVTKGTRAGCVCSIPDVAPTLEHEQQVCMLTGL